MSAEDEKIEFSRILASLRAGKYSILAYVLVAFLIGLAYSNFIATQKFSSSASISVDTPSFSLLSPQAGGDSEQNIYQDAEILTSNLVLYKLIDALALSDDPEFDPRAGTGSVLNSALRLLGLGDPVITTTGSGAGASGLLAATATKLRKAVSVSPVRGTKLITISATTRSPEKSALIANTLAEVFVERKKAETFRVAQERISEIAALLQTTGSDASELSGRLENMRMLLEGQFQNMVNALASRIGAEADAGTPAASGTGQEIAREATPRDLARWEANLRVVQLLSLDSGFVRSRVEDFSQTLGSIQGNLEDLAALDDRTQVVSEAAVPLKPTQPKTALILGSSVIFGLLAGLAMTLGREFSHPLARQAEELERATGIPVIGELPASAAKGPQRPPLAHVASPPAALEREMRNLGAGVVLATPGEAPPWTLITCSGTGEPAALAAAALARNFALAGNRTLLVDADGTVAPGSAGPDHGLHAVLRGAVEPQAAVLRETGPGFELIGPGGDRAEVSDLIVSGRLGPFLTWAEENYDAVVFNAPPALEFPDARILGRHCNATVYAVTGGKTEMSHLRRGLQSLRNARVAVDGLVFLT